MNNQEKTQLKKVALITGGSRGIGRAICLRLAQDGYDIVFNYRSGEQAAQETKQACEAYGVSVCAVSCDVSDSAACDALIQKALEFGGRIDVLVNNAGITRDNLLMKLTDEDLDRVLEVNLKGPFYMMRAIARQMLRQKAGHIINMSSVVGIIGNAGQVNYAASKAAVIGMTKSLARELASRKICVNAVAPGMIATDMTAVLSEEAQEGILSQIPFRQMGQPEDVANMVAFLAGEQSGYITGQVFAVDGGMSC
ncbi:MAG: 3-oxoacyl-[Agathobacter sp.]|uniref:3-oxoacyl-[acyl-carrier-protein] reductase n=1 Tax=Agathobacter sp. TaxID=2021311 RepID=UPI00257D95CC|nr:3-oxoacyl-[acyl-carrier-protein] reductase [Agathobacter sp.]MBQ1681471.1 3-oxoacyl-[acyl-carrier-protein] reductase [Agathobacter sp.]